MAKTDNLQYARDVLLAYQFFRRPFPLELIHEHPSSQAIHELSETPGKHKEFLAMVAKASEQLAKNDKDNTPDDMLKQERRSILDLQSRLAAAVGESQAVVG